jgi:hypothetical protein
MMAIILCVLLRVDSGAAWQRGGARRGCGSAWAGSGLTRLLVSRVYERRIWYSGTMRMWLCVGRKRADTPAGQSVIREEYLVLRYDGEVALRGSDQS